MPTRHGLWPRRVRNCHRRLLRGARLQDPGSDGLSQQGHRRRRRQRRRRVHHQGVRVKLRHGRAPVHSQNRRVRPGRLIMHACMIRPIHQSNINLLSASMCMGGRFHLARPTTTIPSSATGSPLSRGSCAASAKSTWRSEARQRAAEVSGRWRRRRRWRAVQWLHPGRRRGQGRASGGAQAKHAGDRAG